MNIKLEFIRTCLSDPKFLKFGLYPAEDCWMRYGDFRFRQIEILYNMVRIDSAEAHNWLKDNISLKIFTFLENLF